MITQKYLPTPELQFANICQLILFTQDKLICLKQALCFYRNCNQHLFQFLIKIFTDQINCTVITYFLFPYLLTKGKNKQPAMSWTFSQVTQQMQVKLFFSISTPNKLSSNPKLVQPQHYGAQHGPTHTASQLSTLAQPICVTMGRAVLMLKISDLKLAWAYLHYTTD